MTEQENKRQSFESPEPAQITPNTESAQPPSMLGTIKNLFGYGSPLPEEKNQEGNRRSVKKGEKTVSFALPSEDLLRNRPSAKSRRSTLLEEDELKRRMDYEKQMLESKDLVLNDMRESHKSMQESNQS